MIDTAGDGIASYEEFRTSLGSDISENIMNDMIMMLDPNSTGMITLQQFKDFLLSDY